MKGTYPYLAWVLPAGACNGRVLLRKLLVATRGAIVWFRAMGTAGFMPEPDILLMRR